METKEYFTITEAGQILGISRVAVFKKIKKNEIRAIKIGRMFAIPKEEFDSFLGKTLGQAQKALIDEAVKKTVAEYGRTLELLGRN